MDGETAYGGGATFSSQFHTVGIVTSGTAGHSCIINSGRILSCNQLKIEQGARLLGPVGHPGSEIRSVKRPVVDGTWNFVQVADGIYSSNDSRPFFGVPQGGTGLSTLGKDLILIGNDMNAVATDANLSFTSNCLHVDNGIRIGEGSDHPVSPGAGFGLLWVKNTTPSTLIYTDDAGTDTTLGSGGGGITALTGDVTASGSGSVAATIAAGAVEHAMLDADCVDGDNIADDSINSEHYVDGSIDTAHIADDQVTYAKIQNVSATDRILGRDSAGSGIIEEITPANLRTMINVADGATAYADANAAAASLTVGLAQITLSSDITGFTSGSYTKVNLDNVVVDTASAWDNSAKCYDIPAAGKWQVTYQCAMNNLSSSLSTTVAAAIFIDGGGGYNLASRGSYAHVSGDGSGGSVLFDASSGWKIALYLYHNGGSGKTLLGDATVPFVTYLNIRQVGA